MSWPVTAEEWVRAATFLPIIVTSVIGFGLALAKWRQYRQAVAWDPATHLSLVAALNERDYERVRRIVSHDPSLASRLVLSVLPEDRRSTARARERLADVGSRLGRELEAGLDGLRLAATLGPLFGLFGTVVGIVLVFNRLAEGSGAASPRELAAGIGTALYTTICGLIVGVLAVVSHWYLQQRLDRQLAELELVAEELAERLVQEA